MKDTSLIPARFQLEFLGEEIWTSYSLSFAESEKNKFPIFFSPGSAPALLYIPYELSGVQIMRIWWSFYYVKSNILHQNTPKGLCGYLLFREISFKNVLIAYYFYLKLKQWIPLRYSRDTFLLFPLCFLCKYEYCFLNECHLYTIIIVTYL